MSRVVDVKKGINCRILLGLGIFGWKNGNFREVKRWIWKKYIW